MSISDSFYGSGGRKRASARVFIIPTKTGVGKFTINKRDIDNYFPEIAAVDEIAKPLNVLGIKDLLTNHHIKVTVKGGGKTGQRDAVRLGLAKALIMLGDKKNLTTEVVSVEDNQEGDVQKLAYRPQLRKAGLLTRDSRKVERKRYGLHKARKRAPLVKR